MATETLAPSIGEVRAASAASGGTAISTTTAFIEFLPGTRLATITPRELSTAVVARIALDPWLVALFTQDNLATATDGSQAVQDASTATGLTLNSWDTLANGDALYLGSHLPFRGVRVVIGNTNGNASTLTVQYWNGTAWTDVAAQSDGSASAGATFGQTGNVTWTVPTDWVAASLLAINSPAPATGIPYRGAELYWTRWKVSAALDASVSATSLLSMNRATTPAEYVTGQTLEVTVLKGLGGISHLEVVTDAGTGKLIVNCATLGSGRFV